MKKTNVLLPIYVVFSIALFVAILIIPVTNEWFCSMSDAHPFIMGFFKFALLATAGELIAARMAKKAWIAPPKLLIRFIIWGIIGAWITYMMKTFGFGIAGLMQNNLLFSSSNEMLNAFLKALFISATMNLTFGPTFMAVHKCSDTCLELMASGEKVSLKKVVTAVDWYKFVSFTIFKTVPIFWIPAHTITFLLPAEYQVVMAAALSIVLGIILNINKK